MVQIANPAGNFDVLNGALPCEGTKAFPFNLDFSQGNAYGIDLTAQWQNKQFTTIQSVYVDNALGDVPLEIICNTTAQNISCPAKSQGFFALLLPTPPKLIVQSDSNIVIEIILLNFYIPPAVWNIPVVSAAGLPQVDVPALDAVISGGKIQVAGSPATVTGLTDASGTIAAGGTAQALFAANAGRTRFIIANPDTATETLYFRIGANNAGPIPLAPGMIWDESGSTVVGEAIWIEAATTAHAFTAFNN